MALGSKLGIGIVGVVVLGAGIYGLKHAKKSSPAPVQLTSNNTPASPAVTPEPVTPVAVSPAPEPIRTAAPPAETPVHTETPVTTATPPPAENTVTLASPPPPAGAQDAGERSFRAKPEVVTPVEPAPAMAKPPEAAPQPTVAESPAPTPAAPDTTHAPSPAGLPDTSTLAESPREAAKTTAAAASQPAADKPKVHVVATGETYSSIAEKYLGNSKYANLIAKANPGKDPRKLYVGAKLRIPAAPGETATAPDAKSGPATSSKQVRVPTEPVSTVPADRAYKVKNGESWNDLARRYLGDAKRWPELYELNKERVPKNPQALRPGTVIELPAGVKPTTKPS